VASYQRRGSTPPSKALFRTRSDIANAVVPVLGAAVTHRLRAIGIRDRPITPRSPWQNRHVERLIGSVRREILDHVVVLGERHPRDVLASYSTYYNEVRMHVALGKDAPLHRIVQTVDL
jgi:transposase InsO family protein